MIYTIGKFTDMDEIYNDLEKHKKRAIKTGALEHSDKKWTLKLW